MNATPIAERAITHRTRGRRHGPITRLMSPGDLGEVVKPFVFLDLVEKDGPAFAGGLHPHSGIATLTYIIDGRVTYIDPDGSTGVIGSGGVEWMRAGRGMWHGGGAEAGRLLGFQLWIALPPNLELAPCESRYVAAETIEAEGPARVLLGSYGDARALIEYDLPVTYLAVTLAAGENWRFVTPAGHGVLWIAVAEGELAGPDHVGAGEMVVLDRSDAAVTFEAKTDTHFVLGSAVPHPHDLALGQYSVHTSADALAQGERWIEDLGSELRRQGRA